MMSRRWYCISAIAALIMACLTESCTQELCYDHYPTLNVAFDWEQEWERDYGAYHLNGWDTQYFGALYDDLRPEHPEWVNMIRYFDNGSCEEHFLSPQGDSYVVEAERRSSMLLYNGDTEYVVVSDVASMNEARAVATTRSRAGAALQALYEDHRGARTTNPPDILYSAYIENIPGISNHEAKHYNVKMQPLVYTYVIVYEFESGIEHVAMARGAIGGMAEAVYLRTGVTSEETSIILFDCDVKSNGCVANVRSFGAPGFPDIYYGRTPAQPASRNYSLNLELKLRSGKTVDFTYNISDQLKNQPRGGVIRIAGIKVEDDKPQTSSGFEVDLSGRDDNSQVIDLPLGGQNSK